MENTEKLKATTKVQLGRKGEGGGEMAALWVAMGAIVSTPRLWPQRAAKLATPAIASPHSMMGWAAGGLTSASAAAAAVTVAAAVAVPLVAVGTARLRWRRRGRVQIAALWITMGAIVSTPRLEPERAATLATAAIIRPRSMKGGKAVGVLLGAPVTAAAAIPLVRVESIGSKRGTT